MAKKSTNKKNNSVVIPLYQNGYIYYTKKNVKKSKTENKPKISLRKYNPVSRQHETFIEDGQKAKKKQRAQGK